MYYKITSLVALDDYILLLGFSNGEFKKFDLKPLMKKYPPFKDLETIPNLYKQVKIDIGGYGIIWNDYLDLDGTGLYEKGEECEPVFNFELLKTEFISELIKTRKELNLSQKQLEVLSNVSQPIIARIERFQVDPQLSTVIKMLEAMGKKLVIEDIKKS